MRITKLLSTAVLIAAAASARSAAPVHLSDIRYSDGVVKIQLTGPARYQTTPWKAAKRFSVDVDASGIDLQLRELPVFAARLKTVRWNQWKPDSVRIVLDLSTTQMPVVLSSPPTNVIEIRVGPSAKSSVTPPAPGVSDDPAGPPDKPAVPPPSSAAKIERVSPTPPDARAAIGEIEVQRDDNGRPSAIIVRTDRDTAVKADWWDNHLAIDLPDAAGDTERIVPINDPIVARVRTGAFKAHGRVVIDMSRRVGYKVSPLDDGPGFVVDLALDSDDAVDTQAEPQSAAPVGHTLEGKLIVLDPGHGDHDKGAHSQWVVEKAANLDIALRLRDVLESQGARVIMTRSDDTFIPLHERPAIAMRAHAAAFISIHCNSSARPVNHGTEVFYRRNDRESRRLATALYDAHRAQTGIPGRAVKPDSGAPQGGLAVLKHTSVPCALVEVAFVNWPDEGKKLATAAWRQTVAEGLAKGLAAYMRGNGDTAREGQG